MRVRRFISTCFLFFCSNNCICICICSFFFLCIKTGQDQSPRRYQFNNETTRNKKKNLHTAHRTGPSPSPRLPLFIYSFPGFCFFCAAFLILPSFLCSFFSPVFPFAFLFFLLPFLLLSFFFCVCAFLVLPSLSLFVPASTERKKRARHDTDTKRQTKTLLTRQQVTMAKNK